MEDVAVCWFRQDMRLSDNPALSAAAEHHYVLPVYILIPKIREHLSPERQAIGGCIARCALNQSLGGKLSVYEGDPKQILADIVQRLPVTAVHWNRCYEPWSMERDTKIKTIYSKWAYRAKATTARFYGNPGILKG